MEAMEDAIPIEGINHYYNNSVDLNICDMKKDQESDYRADIATLLTPERFHYVVGSAPLVKRKFESKEVKSKEVMAAEILAVQYKEGGNNINKPNVYDALQDAAIGQEGNIFVRWSGEKYIFKCYDNRTLAAADLGDLVAIPICRITDTTRGGAAFIANLPDGGNVYNFIQAHTPPVENDPCGKMNLVSLKKADFPGISDPAFEAMKNKFKKRYFIEKSSGNKKMGYPKIKYPAFTDGKDPLSHLFMTREINLEYRGVKDPSKGNLDVVMTYINEKGKPVLIDEQTNTAGAFKKIKQKFKKALNIATSKSQHEMIHISKLHGDVGQVLEKWREFPLVNFEEPKVEVLSKNYRKAFEAYDSNAVMKAFLEGVDIIFFHVWEKPALVEQAVRPERILICVKDINIKKIYESLIQTYTTYRSTIEAEMAIYNGKIQEIKDKRQIFKEAVNNIPNEDLQAPVLDDNKINTIYKKILEHFCKAAILETYVAPDEFEGGMVNLPPDFQYLPVGRAASDLNEENEGDIALMRGFILNLKTGIQDLNDLRKSFVIPVKYLEQSVTFVNNNKQELMPVDLEKEINIEEKGSKVKGLVRRIFDQINITLPLGSGRSKGIYSNTNSRLGTQLITFIYNRCRKFETHYVKLLTELKKVCVRNDIVSIKTQQSLNFDFLLNTIPAVQPQVAQGGGRNKPNNNEPSENWLVEANNKNKLRKMLEMSEYTVEPTEGVNDSLINLTTENRKETPFESIENPPEVVPKNGEEEKSALEDLNKQAKEALVENETSKTSIVNLSYSVNGEVIHQVNIDIDRILKNFKIIISEIKEASNLAFRILHENDNDKILEMLKDYIQINHTGGAHKIFGKYEGSRVAVYYGFKIEPSIVYESDDPRNVSRVAKYQAEKFYQKEKARFNLSRRVRKPARVSFGNNRTRKILSFPGVTPIKVTYPIDKKLLEIDSLNENSFCSSYCSLEMDFEILEAMKQTLIRYTSMGELILTRARHQLIKDIIDDINLIQENPENLNMASVCDPTPSVANGGGYRPTRRKACHQTKKRRSIQRKTRAKK